ncbi:MAG: hypothetical protein HZA46_14695 [Planctomycetales bacterium]|nr:hypothetical protein [Planctomycetales bacterium]
MEKFLEKYNQQITGTLSCFDRVIFKGYLPLGWPDAMESLLARQGLRIMDFKRFVTEQSARFKKLANDVCEKAGRPPVYLRGREKTEKRPREEGKARGADDPQRETHGRAGVCAQRGGIVPELCGGSPCSNESSCTSAYHG